MHVIELEILVSSRQVRRGRGASRLAGVLLATAVTAGSAVATAGAAFAEESAPTPTLQTFSVDAFVDAAAELPSGLTQAVERDLGLTAPEYLANAAAAKVAADVVAQLRADGVGIESAAIAGQDVTLYVSADADVAAAEATGAKVEVGLPDIDTSGVEERELHFNDDFKGGYGYATLDDVENPTSANRCSAGFNGTAGDGSPLFLTAGHCGADFEEGHPWFHLDVDSPLFDDQNWAGPELTERPLGENGAMHLGDGEDGGVVHVTEPGWTTPPQVAYWGGGTGAPDDGNSIKVYDSTNAIVGQPACKSGATSGWTCGEILFAEDTVEIGVGENETAAVTAFIFTACMLSGDSGGSIVSGHYALGVDSFSTAATTATCDNTNWNPATVYEAGGASDGDIGGGYAVTSGTANAELLLGDDFNLNIFVGKPVVTAPEEGGTTSQKPTISGKVSAAEGAKVTVEIDGGPTVEGTVGADGTWSAAVDEALEPGSYTYSVTASHTAKGASEATTSGTAEGSFEVVENQVADLTVESPSNGQTTGNARPTFNGTGEPGATVTLVVGEDTLGEATVAEDGTWSIAPSADAPIGVRFDATVSQDAAGEVQEVVVSDLGITAPAVTITAPEDGAEVAGDVVITGTAFPGSDVALTIEGTVAGADEPTTRSSAAADAAEAWTGDFAIDDNGAWTFTPAEAIPAGEFTLTAAASVADGDPELTTSEASVSFTVVADDNGDSGDAGGTDDGNDDLPDTGSSSLPLILIGAALLLAGGTAVALKARKNRNTPTEV